MSGEKTEKPTPKKLRDLRRKGVSAKSQDLPSALALAAACLVMTATVGKLAGAMDGILRECIAAASRPGLPEATGVLTHAAGRAVSAAAPTLALLVVITLACHLAVSRARPNRAALKPRTEVLQPQKAVKRLLGPQGMADLARNTAKLTVLAAAAYSCLPRAAQELSRGPMRLEGIMSSFGGVLSDLVIRVLGAALLIGVLDAVWNLRRFRRQSRMTKQEVKDENRQAEGDPLLRAAQRSRQQRAARQRMINGVDTADVVLANPTHIAVALRYDPEQHAPVVVARGAGLLAQRIKARAAEHDVPVMENRPLARALYAACRTGDHIPVHLYEAVAEILARVYQARHRRPGAHR